MIRKKVLDEVGWYTVDKKLLRVEDYHLWFKIYAKGYIGYNLSEPLYKMRDNSEAYKRRTWNSRFNSFRLRLIGYKMLEIPFYKYIYCIRPILIYLLPNKFYDILHKEKLSKEKK